MVVIFLGEFDDTYTDDCVRPQLCHLSDKRARCALNKEMLYLLNEESILGVHSSRGSL